MSENNSDEIQLRWLAEDEWQIYRDLRLEALKADPPAFGSSYEDEVNNPEQLWKDRAKNILFAFVEEQPVGLIGHFRQPRVKEKHVAHIVSFYVKENYRNMGIGKLLLDGIISRIREYGDVTKVDLSVTTIQTPAYNVYKKYGFQKAGLLRKELKIGEEYFDLIEMEYFL